MWAQSAQEIGKIVALGRRHRGLTQAQLAKGLGVTQNWISQIELGKDTARLGKVLQVLSFLGIRLQVAEAPWLVGTLRQPAKASSAKRRTSVNISLADIIAAHSGPNVSRRKAKR